MHISDEIEQTIYEQKLRSWQYLDDFETWASMYIPILSSDTMKFPAWYYQYEEENHIEESLSDVSVQIKWTPVNLRHYWKR